MTTKSWTVQISLDEQGDETFADATLRVDGEQEIRGRGMSRRNPTDPTVPQIGDELATARALSHLAHQLLDTAASDIESRTHEPVGSLRL